LVAIDARDDTQTGANEPVRKPASTAEQIHAYDILSRVLGVFAHPFAQSSHHPVTSLFVVLRVRGLTSMDPVIYLRSLEFPKPAYAMPWKPLVRNPRIDSVLADTQVRGDFVG
jgi:hypothetical protein